MVQLAKQYDEKKLVKMLASTAVWASAKLDGVRLILKLDTAAMRAEPLSRSGKPIASMQAFGDVVLALLAPYVPQGTMYLDGEVTIGGFFEGIGEIRSKTPVTPSKVKFTVFQMLLDEDLDPAKAHRTFEDRWGAAKGLAAVLRNGGLDVWASDERLVTSIVQINRLYEQAREQGKEGLILKDSQGVHIEGRKGSWMKMKPEETLDLPIIGTFQLYSETRQEFMPLLGGVVCRLPGGGEVSVGSGFTREEREMFWLKPPIGRIAEVSFMEMTPGGSLRHSAFKRLRDLDQYPGSKL